MALTAEQRANALTIIRTGESIPVDDQTIAAALATALMESGLVNNPGGDADSAGLFQQRPSQGWGSYEDVTNPEQSALAFFRAYTRNHGATVLERIANTQRPLEALRGRYADNFAEAEGIFRELAGRSAPTLTGRSIETSVVPSGGDYTPPGSGAGGTAVPKEAPPSTPEEIDAYIRKHYPDVAGLLDVPDIKTILLEAATQQLDPTELQARVRQTEYWKTTGPAARAWDILQSTDPSAARDKYLRAGGLVERAASQAGLTLTPDDIFRMTGDYLRGGWDSTDLSRAVVGKLRERQGGGALPVGSPVGVQADALGAVAKQFGVPVTRKYLEDWALDIAGGVKTIDGFKGEITDHAKGLFQNDPEVLTAIQAGRSPAQFFEPYRQLVADTIGVTPDAVDILNDPIYAQYRSMYDPSLNSGKGGQRTPTLAEAGFTARQDPRFGKTDTYNLAKQQVGMNLAHSLGVLG